MNTYNQSKRLVEYFAVVGLDPAETPVEVDKGKKQKHLHKLVLSDSDMPSKSLYVAKVLDRYPLTDHKDNPFLSGIAMFCMPEGGAEVTHEMKLPKFLEFVSTGSGGSHLYGFSLTIYEPLHSKHAQQLGLSEKNKPQVAKALCILSYWPYVTCFRKFLIELYRRSLSPLSIPLERLICNFVSEVPLPPLGQARVQYNIGDTELFFERPPLNNPIAWVDLPFKALFEALDLDNLLKVFACVLTERQILIESSQYLLIATLAEALRLFLYPFEWPHVYIPVLPRGLLMVLQAPLPYIIGIHSDTLQFAYKTLSLPEKVVHIKLDSNLVNVSPSHPILPLPAHDTRKLITRLQQCAPAFVQRSENWEKEVLPNLDNGIALAARPCDFEVNHQEYSSKSASRAMTMARTGELEFESLNGCDWLLVRAAFFRFFVAMLKDYKECLVYPVKKSSTRAVDEADRRKQAGSFNEKKFIWKKKKTERSFYMRLVKTQPFQNFIDDRLHPDGARDADGFFFDESINAKQNRSLVSKIFPAIKFDTAFLNAHDLYAVKKTVVAQGPDMSELEEFKQQEGTMLQTFPKLSATWYYCPRKMPDMPDVKHELLQRSTSNLQKNDGRLGDLDISSASGAVYATWFMLYCASIGVNTPNSLDKEYYEQLFQGVQSDIDSSASTGTIGDLSEETEEKDSENSINLRNCKTSSIHLQAKGTRRRKSENFNRSSDCSNSDLVQQEQAKAEIEALRKERALEELELAFSVLQASRDWGASADQLVYRALIDCCGRCGATDHAVQVLGMMHDEGLQPDSLVYSNLVQAFSMNGDQNFKMDIVRWENLKREVSAAASRMKSKPSRISRSASSGSSAAPNAALKKFIRRWGTREEIYSRSDSSMMRYSQSFDGSEVQREFPGVMLDTEIELCPGCKENMSDEEIRMGWSKDPHEYTTQCPRCQRKFVARFAVTGSCEVKLEDGVVLKNIKPGEISKVDGCEGNVSIGDDVLCKLKGWDKSLKGVVVGCSDGFTTEPLFCLPESERHKLYEHAYSSSENYSGNGKELDLSEDCNDDSLRSAPSTIPSVKKKRPKSWGGGHLFTVLQRYN